MKGSHEIAPSNPRSQCTSFPASRENVFKFIPSKYQQKSDFFLPRRLKSTRTDPVFTRFSQTKVFPSIFWTNSSQWQTTSTRTHAFRKFRRIYSLQNRLAPWVSRRARKLRPNRGFLQGAVQNKRPRCQELLLPANHVLNRTVNGGS